MNLHNQLLKIYKKLSNKLPTDPRGIPVYETFIEHLIIEPGNSIINFYNRPFNWSYFLGEICWYFSKSQSIEWISKFSSFWNNIADNNGNINSNYGKILFNEQLSWAYNKLKGDKYTRQAISFINGKDYQYNGNKDFICTMYLNFWIRDNKLYMKVQMRSNDLFYGTTFDIPFFAIIHKSMLNSLLETYPELTLGEYYHYADNMHFYEKHKPVVDKICKSRKYNQVFIIERNPLLIINEHTTILTDAAKTLLAETEQMINISKITNTEAKIILQKYFYIQ